MSGDENGEPLRLEPIERLEDLRQDWDRLAPHAGHPFATWEWNSRWWEHFGGGRSLYSFAGRDRDGVVRVILPLYMAKTRPLGLARFLGYADLHSPLCEEADRPLAAQMLRSLTRRPHRCRLALLERMPADQGWAELLGGRRLQSGPDPALRIDGRSWDEVLGSFSRNLRQQIRRRERRLVEEHGLSLRMTATAEELHGDLDTLFRLHAERWGEQTTGVFAGDRAQFNRAFAADMLQGGRLRLWIAEVDGERAAAWYGWRFAGSDWYYQAGRDPRFDDLSVGLVLFAHTIRQACEDDIGTYRMLAGDEDYKLRFASEDPGCETRLLGPAPLTALGQVAWKLSRSS